MTGIRVRLDAVTPLVQRWVSPRTGRAYEVPPAQGVRGARAGERGVVVLRDGRLHVQRGTGDDPEED